MRNTAFISTLHHFNLIHAVTSNNWNLFIASLPHVKNVDILHNGQNLLMYAVDNLSMTQKLVEYGANTGSVNPEYIESLEVLEYLANNGMPINKRDTHGNTPLIYAITANNAPRVEKLITLGADVHIRNKSNQTPIYAASISSQLYNTQITDCILATAKKPQDFDLFIEELVLLQSSDNIFIVEKDFSELQMKILAMKEQMILNESLLPGDTRRTIKI